MRGLPLISVNSVISLLSEISPRLMGQREVLCTDIQQEQYETVSIAEV